MPDRAWSYDVSTGRYRGPDGRFVSEKALLALRDGLVDASAARVAKLTEAFANGGSLSAWETGMRAELRSLAATSYLLGRGGINLMGTADLERVGKFVADQEAYLHRFAKAIADGDLSAAQVAARAAMYPRATRTTFDRARGAARGVDLPGYPGSGTRCGANCRCSWRITETKTKVVARWELGDARHCPDCAARAVKWGRVEFDKDVPETPEREGEAA